MGWKTLRKAITIQLGVIPISDFRHLFEVQLLRHYVTYQGNYYEGDRVDL